jgi:hypothetical protein
VVSLRVGAGLVIQSKAKVHPQKEDSQTLEGVLCWRSQDLKLLLGSVEMGVVSLDNKVMCH